MFWNVKICIWMDFVLFLIFSFIIVLFRLFWIYWYAYWKIIFKKKQFYTPYWRLPLLFQIAGRCADDIRNKTEESNYLSILNWWHLNLSILNCSGRMAITFDINSLHESPQKIFDVCSYFYSILHRNHILHHSRGYSDPQILYLTVSAWY